MHGPLFSTITLFTELLVSCAVYYTIYKGYRHHKFPTKIAFTALLYETIFNISYMFSRVPSHAKAAKATPLFLILLAIIHGTLSLIMFVALIVFFILAWKNYKKEKNYFLEHKKITFLFLFFWTFSIVSGVLFYFLEYGV
jgi:hypothetical protein